MRTRLEDSLPAAIALVNAQAHVIADGNTIEDPVEVLSYVPALEMQTQWPVVGIQRDPATLKDDLGWSATCEGSLTIVAFLQEQDQQALADKLDRYMQALATAALVDRSLGGAGGAAWALRAGQINFGPALGDIPAGTEIPEAFLSWVTFTVGFSADD